MTDLERLLKELDNCRWFIMNQLADECEDRGEVVTASGWRWLANNQRWPKMRIRKTESAVTVSHWFNGYAVRKLYSARSSKDPDRLPDPVLKAMSRKGSKDLSKLLQAAAVAVGHWLKESL